MQFSPTDELADFIQRRKLNSHDLTIPHSPMITKKRKKNQYAEYNDTISTPIAFKSRLRLVSMDEKFDFDVKKPADMDEDSLSVDPLVLSLVARDVMIKNPVKNIRKKKIVPHSPMLRTRERFKQKKEEEKNYLSTKTTKNFFKPTQHKSYTEFQPFSFATANRSGHRKRFDELSRKKQNDAKDKKEQQRKNHEEREFEIFKKQFTPKTNKIKHQNQTTIPKTPLFATNQRLGHY
eukprot:TRINITY_DN1926_c0_g1_i1.p1 TRINITY_DN1926_c0_g1~~TRINITY_DN1926_c0_g1_i1.p1  ORF type:complete len:235 (-),score=54.22 TRINITY_DN1926_c0_g1_i1:11-715(-)